MEDSSKFCIYKVILMKNEYMNVNMWADIVVNFDVKWIAVHSFIYK